VEKYLVKNPTEYGKPLVGNLKGLWSYRFSDYRVIYQVQQSELLILVVKIGHRKGIY
jgi:mRNA interferase RelE/StbE